MKQNTFKWLSYSLILLASFSCKKEKGELSDFPRGRFNFVFSWKLNGIDETINGEVSGPFLTQGDYIFQIRPLTNVEYDQICLSSYRDIFRIDLGHSDITANVTSFEHDSDNLNVQYQSGDTLSGFFKLIRIE